MRRGDDYSERGNTRRAPGAPVDYGRHSRRCPDDGQRREQGIAEERKVLSRTEAPAPQGSICDRHRLDLCLGLAVSREGRGTSGAQKDGALEAPTETRSFKRPRQRGWVFSNAQPTPAGSMRASGATKLLGNAGPLCFASSFRSRGRCLFRGAKRQLAPDGALDFVSTFVPGRARCSALVYP